MPDFDPFAAWSEIDKSLNPMMPQREHEARRTAFFYGTAAPQLKQRTPNIDMTEAYSYFMQNTERKDLMGPLDHAGIQLGVAATAAAKDLIAPATVLPHVKQLYDSIDSKQQDFTRMAERDNVSTSVAEVGGSILGAAIPMEGLLGIAGRVAPIVGRALVDGARAQEVVSRLARGGLAFATYSALSEQDNDKRLVSGLKGAALGVGGEVALLPFGRASERALAGQERLEVPKDVETAKAVQSSAEIAKQEKRPVNVTATTTLKQGTVNAITKDAEGNVAPISFRKGAEQTAHGKINDIVNQGGEIVGFEHHPDQLGRVQEILKRYSDEIEPKYVEGKIRAKTTSGTSVELPGAYEQAVSTKADEELKAFENRPPESTESTPAKPPSTEITDQELDEMFGPPEKREGVPDEPHRRLRVEWPDSATQQVFNLGNLRFTSKFRGQTAAITGDIYGPMNHIAGDIGEQFGIPTREKVGDYALDYHQKATEAMRQLEPGSVFRAPSVKDELQQMSESLGGTPGVRPPPFKTLPAKRAAMRAALEAEAKGKPPLKAADLIVPPGEQMALTPEEVASGRIRQRPQGTSVVVKELTGAQGATLRTPEGPITIITEHSPKEVMFHENIHSGMNTIGADELIMSHIGENHRGTAMAIASGLKVNPAYSPDGLKSLLNEAYTHAATAVRFNQSAVLDVLGRMDTDVPTVVSFVNSTSKNILDHASSQIDSMPNRILQRRLTDIVRRSNTEISHTLFLAMDQIGGSAHFDPGMGLWLLKDSAGNETAVKDLTKAWDWIANHDGGDVLPSVSLSAEFGGVRGPIVPRGTEPGTGSINQDFSGADIPGLGLNAVDQYLAPLLGAVDRLDTRVNSVLARYGDKVPLYDTVRRAVDKSKDVMSAAAKQAEDFRFIGRGTPQERWHDYFELMTKATEEERNKTAIALGLGKEDLEKADKLKLWFDRFETETSLPVNRYLTEDFNALRDANFNHKEAFRTLDVDKGDFFQYAAYTGRLNTQDTHLGRFAGWLMKESQIQQMRPLLAKLEEIVGSPENDEKAAKLLGPARYGLQNYIKFMRGVPDRSAQIINKVADDFLEAGGRKAAEMNKHLPPGAQLPTDWGQGRSAVNRLMQFLTAAGVGGRPATLVRDLFASTNTMYVVGPVRFAKGLSRILTKEGWNEADRLGFFMPAGRTVGSTWGEDILGEVNPYGKMDALSKGVDKLLAPNRIAHNISRGIAGFSEYEAALDSIAKYRSGDLAALRRGTSLWHADKAAQTYLERLAFDKTVPLQQAAKTFAQQIVNDTQAGFSKGTQPAALRTGLGRVFGQYGSFPAFYLEYVRRLGRKAVIEHEPRGMAALGMFVATQYGAYKAAEAAGVDISKWVGLSAAGYSGGPAFEAVLAAMRAPENSQQGRDARKQLLELASGKEFIPGSVQLHYLWKGLDMAGPLFDNSGVPTQKFWTMMGFATTDATPQDQDFDEWVKWEAGFGRKR